MKVRKLAGFALVLVLTLLALLVLLIYALTALGRIDDRIIGNATYRLQARQNARIGIGLAFGELQKLAGPDDRITGMAGIAGAAAGAGNAARQWCGVWGRDGTFLGWLASGSGTVPSLAAAELDGIEIVSNGAVGSDATDREHVRVRKLPLTVTDERGMTATTGRTAYWVGDEGVKLSLGLPASESGGSEPHAINQHFPSLSPGDARFAKLLFYEQVALAGATTVQRQGGFHTHGVMHQGNIAGVRRAGLLNVNSSSARYWSGVAATFNLWRDPSTQPLANITAFANQLASNSLWGSAGQGKLAGGPFQSVPDFFANPRVQTAITAGGARAVDFQTVMEPWLTARSDTFRIRAYGEALNPVPEPGQGLGRIEAVAWCEAMVQRVPETLPGLGRRFVVVSFRWMGPDDI